MSDLERLTVALSDRYRIERELGAGGMATVYLAEDVRHRRQVAVKVMRPELAASLGADRFLREIEVTAALQHPHVLALYDSGQAGGFLYYVMPYVQGDSLRVRLNTEGQLPLHDAVRIARGTAAALAYAHRNGVVHRDIKPENILLVDGEALVADFGIARAVAVAGGDTLTGTGITLGTPTYMSPEQAAAEKQLDGRSDVYSLGCVLYEMLAGEPPYNGPTAQVITARKLNEPVPSLRTIRDSVPPLLEEIIARALARAPADRFSSADEMASLLERAISAPHTATMPTFAVPGSRVPPWRRWLWQALAAAGLAVGAVAVWWAAGATRDGEPERPVQRFSIVLPDSIPMAFVGEAPGRLGRPSLALSRDGRTLVYVGWYRGRTHLFVRPMDDDRVRRLGGTEGAYAPFFSPNGRWVGFLSKDKLHKVSLDGGAPLELAADPGAFTAAWPRQDIIVFPGDSGLMVIGENGESATQIRLPFMPYGLHAADGELMAASNGFTSALISLKDTTTWTLNENRFVRRRAQDLAQEMSWGRTERGLDASAQLLGQDVMLAVDEGRLHAVAFDPRSMNLRGPIVPMMEQVRQERFGAQAQFAVGGDGTLVFAPGVDVAQAVLVAIDMQGRVDTLPLPRASYEDLAISPDGRRLAAVVRVARGWELWILDITGRAPRVVVTSEWDGVWMSFWSGDGTRLIFSTDSSSSEVRASGGPVERKAMWRWPSGESADGKWRAYNDTISTVIESRSGDTTRLPSYLFTPEFSRDGRWVSWTASGNRGAEVYVSALPLGGPVFPVTPDGCADARWRADSRALICLKDDGYLYLVPLIFERGDVRAQSLRRLTSVVSLRGANTVRGWALTPNDQRMIIVAGTPVDTTTRLRVVTNYRREVERKLAEAKGKAKP